jgi:DNA mismatch repair protein MutL
MPIRVLPPDVSNKIAAGEVVERPASVVKELLENSLDAGASRVRVEIREGGRRLIRVEDDGCGISAGEVELAFARHATSKLTDAAELGEIRTLGFRGEALSSVAAVSEMTLLTRTASDESATRVRLSGGEVVSRDQLGAPAGTVVIVENLFFNTPARLKFMRTPATESGHIHKAVTNYAMANPNRRFSLVSDGRLVFQTTANGKLYDVLLQLHGLEVARQLLEIGPADDHLLRNPLGSSPHAGTDLSPSSCLVSGYVGPPSVNRSSRQHMTFFANRRWIRDRSLSFAVSQAYHTLLPAGRFPLAVVFVWLPAEAVDVNVHPTKAEVRFRDAREVFHTVQREVRRVLVDQAPMSRIIRPGTAWSSHGLSRQQQLSTAGKDRTVQLDLPSADRGTESGLEASPPASATLPMLRVVGQLGATYVVAEGPEGLYLIDQHAAHERVLFDRLAAEQASQAITTQGLLEAMTVQLSPLQVAIVEANLDLLLQAGFEMEPFGGDTILLRGVPAILSDMDPQQAILNIVDDLLEERSAGAEEREDRLKRIVCKQAAIKAGQVLSVQEMEQLVRQLEQTSSPRTCPHGRPTMLHMSAHQLAREFGRL